MYVSETYMRKCIIKDRQTKIFITIRMCLFPLQSKHKFKILFTCYQQIIGPDNKTC